MNAVRADIEAAVVHMGIRLGARRELAKLREHLWDGERVDALAGGNHDGRLGLVVLTDHRLLFLFEGLLQRRSEDLPLGRVAAVQWEHGLLHGTVTVYANGTRVQVRHVDKKAGKRLVDLVRAHIVGPARGVTTGHERIPALTPSDDPYDQLTRLGTLREAGVLTEQEFQAKKREILSRI